MIKDIKKIKKLIFFLIIYDNFGTHYQNEVCTDPLECRMGFASTSSLVTSTPHGGQMFSNIYIKQARL